MEATPPQRNGPRLDEDLARQMDEYARAQGLTSTELIHQILAEFIASQSPQHAQHPRESLSELADSIAAEVPDEEWAKLPADLAKNFDHYAFGYPREE